MRLEIIEYLYESLGQIVEYAPVHMRVKSEFTEAVEAFMSLSDKFARTPEATEVRKNISKLYYEIYEAVVKKSMDDEDVPLAVRLFLDYGFVSEKLLEELDTMLRLRPEMDQAEDGCRVYTMSKWLQAVYDGVKETSKNEFDEDFATYLRRQLKEQKITQKRDGRSDCGQGAADAFLNVRICSVMHPASSMEILRCLYRFSVQTVFSAI